MKRQQFRNFKKVVAAFIILALVVTGLYMNPVETQAAVKATKITLNAKSRELTVGKSITLKVKSVTPKNASKAVTWKTSNKKVATVNSKGKVTAKKAGSATITAVSKTNKKVTATCKIKVYAKVNKITLNYTSKKLKEGESFTLKATVSPKKAKQDVTYRSADTTVATVNSNGKVTAKKTGSTTITVTSKDNNKVSTTCKITVQQAAVPTGTLTPKKVYASIIAMKSKYPEGMPWTNDNFYAWKGGIYYGGYGCAGFAFAMSDAAFGELPAKKHTDFSKIRVGDILRINNDTHSVIILAIDGDTLTIAEGNFNSSIHWGRKLSISESKSSWTYVLTRYPD
ncbi:MAG: Ig-like domain-containing protein [Lachnospiraceae bacterium]|nr:Ig-like domain-containing protein [Lachnospiraceae bacterium]